MAEESSDLLAGDVADHKNEESTKLQVFVCSVCGEDHDTENCPVICGLTQIHDSRILTRARQTLPHNLVVRALVDGSTSVITNVKISQGTQFGPFQAPLSLDLPPTVVFPLKVFGNSFDDGYYLDTSDEESCNWMCLVAPATNTREQNLICYDVKQRIYFATTRDVQPGEELRLWYALYYGLKLQALPLADDCVEESEALDTCIDDIDAKLKLHGNIFVGDDLLQTLTQHLPAHVLGAPGERDLWICKLCGEQNSNVASYARHLMTHYRQPLHHNFDPQCRICAKYFFSKKALDEHLSRIHNCNGEESNILIHSGKRCLSPLPEAESIQTGKLSIKMKDIEKATDTASSTSSQNILPNALNGSDSTSGTSERHCGYEGGKDSKDSLTLYSDLNSVDHKLLVQEKFHPPDLARDQAISIQSEFQRKHEGVNVDSSDSGKFSASFVLTEDRPLGNEGTIQFVVLEPSHVSESSMIVKDGNQDSNCDSTFDPSCDGSSVLPLNVINPSVTCTQLASLGQITLPFTCDICQKSFQKCSYLYRHLRKHTGEFTCVTCLAVFARKENLKTHSCAQPKEWFPCLVCGKKFSAKKYLQRHTPMHTGEFTCSECKRLFVSRLSLKLHRCRLQENRSVESTVSCVLCRHVFDSGEQLKVHLKVHSYVNADIKKTSSSKSRQLKSQILGAQKNCHDDLNFKPIEPAEEKIFICEVCGATFKSSSSMKTHMFCHGERKFECEICKKRFHRKDVLQEHLKVHQEANFPCVLCGKKYKTKKSLYVHSLIHGGSKRFSCAVCGKRFFQKGNLHKHVQTHAPERTYSCKFCQKTFSSKEYFNIHELTHTQGKIYHCSECQRSFVKKHLLDTHCQLFHSNRGFLCKFCNTVIRHRHSVRRHLEKYHSDHIEEWSLPGFIDQLLAEVPSNLVQPSRDSKSSKTQLKRQEVLESLRNKHFQKTCQFPVDGGTSSNFFYSPISLEASSNNINQEDSSVLFPSHQLAFVDPTLPEYDQSQSSTTDRKSLMIPEDMHASEGEILLTLVDEDTLNSSIGNSSAPVLTTATLESDITGLSSGTSLLMEDGSATNSVLLYIVETSDVDDGDTETEESTMWCSEAVKEQL